MVMTMIAVTFRMVIPPEKHAEVTEILTRTAERTNLEQGCMSCHLYSDLSDSSDSRGFMLGEVWKTNDDLTHYLKSEIVRDVLIVAEVALEAPEITFSELLPGDGMATIEKARSGKK
jgi:quinol monooxygenase YgiN